MACKKIEVNRAAVEDFEQLIGVGHCKAEAIVKHRKSIGGFVSVNELSRVPGVGYSVVEQNRSLLLCSDSPTPRSLHLSSDSPAPQDEASTSQCQSVLSRLEDDSRQVKASPRDSDEASTSVETPDASNPGQLFDGVLSQSRDAESLGTGQDSDMPDVTLSFDSHGIHSHGELHSHYSDRPDSSSVFSETFHSHPYRSRIPVPVAGSYHGNHMMKRKYYLNREDSGIYPPGKRLRRGEGLTSSCLRGQHGRPHSLAAVQRSRIPSKENPPPKLAEWLNTFKSWSNAERMMALDELIGICEPTQVRHMMQVIEPQFQRDFISLLPKELALYVLSFLDPKDLLRAAQTCRYWRILAEDNLLWREKCREETNIDEFDEK
ncbi:hypothetical protein ScPMuIL_011551 [Solemya velum]